MSNTPKTNNLFHDLYLIKFGLIEDLSLGSQELIR